MPSHTTLPRTSASDSENDLESTPSESIPAKRRGVRQNRDYSPADYDVPEDAMSDDGRLRPISSLRATFAILHHAQEAGVTLREMKVLTGLMNLSLKWGRLDLEFSHPYLAKWTGLDPDRHSPHLKSLAERGIIDYTPGKMYRGSDGLMHCAWSRVTLVLPDEWESADPSSDKPVVERSRTIEDVVSRDRTTPSHETGTTPPATEERHLPSAWEVEGVEQSSGRTESGRDDSPALAPRREQAASSAWTIPEERAHGGATSSAPSADEGLEEQEKGSSRSEDRDFALAHQTPVVDQTDDERQTILRADGSQISLRVDATASNVVDMLLGALTDSQRGRLLRFKDVEDELRESVGVWSHGRTLHADPKSVLALLGHWYTFRGGRNAQYADSTFRSGQKRLLAHMNDRGLTWVQSMDGLTPAQVLVLGMKIGVKHRREVDAERYSTLEIREMVRGD